jgi:ABC-type microcin C transport system permease subunit YejE
MVARHGASFWYVVNSQFSAILPPSSVAFALVLPFEWRSLAFVHRWQELEIRARDRYAQATAVEIPDDDVPPG